MKKKNEKKSLDQLQLNPLQKSETRMIKGGSGDTTDDIVVVDVITT